MSADTRHAVRALRRRPIASASAIVTLALALAASVVLLLVLHALYWAPLPYGNGERLRVVHADMSKIGVAEAGLSWALAVQIEGLPAVRQLAVWQADQVALRTGDLPESLPAIRAEATLFDVLGADVFAAGRPYRVDEIEQGESVVVVGHAFARERFGSITAALDAELSIDGRVHRIVGVLAADASFPDRSRSLLLPLARPADAASQMDNFGDIQVLALLTDASADSALTTQLDTLIDGMVTASDEFRAMQEITGLRLVASSWRQRVAGGIGGTLGLLAVALVGLLLLAASNVSNVLMERCAARRGELAVRVALGATRGRLARLVLSEAALLSLAGWLLGLLLCALLLSAQQQWQWLALPTGLKLSLAWPPVALSLLLAGLLSLATAWFPAWLASRLQAGSGALVQRGGSDGRAYRARRALVVSQGAISVALLIVAALLARSLFGLWQVDPGWQREGVLSAEIEPRGERYAAPAQRLLLAHQLIDAARGVPGVGAVAVTGMLPFGSSYSMSTYEVEGRTDPEQPPVAPSAAVSADYFQAMGIPLLRGRSFDVREDGHIELPVAVIDQRLARQHFGDEDPVGQRLRLGPGEWLQIVGVVGAVRQRSLADEAEPGLIYLPLAWAVPDHLNLVLQSRLPIASIVPGLRQAVHGLDSALPLRRTATMQQRLDDSLRGRTGPLGIVVFFALVAVLLAGVGLYGLLATAVIERRPEIGVRLALGAQRRDILTAVMGDGLRLLAIGIGLGVVLAWLAIPLLRQHLFGVAAGDPVSLVAATALLLLIGLVATVFPAWRASRVEPGVALRGD